MAVLKKPAHRSIMVASLLLAAFIALFVAVNSTRAESDSPADNPSLTIAHFAPFATEVVSTSVTVRVVGVGDVLSDFTFGEIETGITALAAGTYTIEIVPTGTMTPAITQEVTIADDMAYTVAAVGNGVEQPLELQAYVDDSTLPDAGKSNVIIRHLAPFAGTLPDTAVDLCAAPGTVLESDFRYKESTTAMLDVGIYSEVFIAATGNNCTESSKLLSVPVFAARDGVNSYVYAIGDGSNQPLQVGQAGLTARAAVAHLAPFATSPMGTSVTVTLDGTEIASDLKFGERWPDSTLSYTELDLGNYDVEVIPTGQTEAAITATAVISGFLDFTFIALGDGTLQPLEIIRTIDDNTTPAPGGQARTRIGHFAPFADSAAGTTVDICTSINGEPLLNDVPYKAYASLNLPAGTYDSVFIGQASPNCSQVILPIPTFILSENSPAYLYAIGDGTNIDIGATATPLSVIASRVSVAHFAPFAPNAEGTSVRIELDGSEILTNVLYSQISPYLTVPSGKYKVDVYPTSTVASAADPAISRAITLQPANDFTVAAIGDGSNQPLELIRLKDDNSVPPSGKGRVSVSHLAPFADTLAGTNVDLCVAQNEEPLVNDFEYKESASLILDPGLYTTVFIGKSSPDCSDVILPVPSFFVTEGANGRVYAIGDGPNFPVSITSSTPEILAEVTRLPVIFN